VRIRLLFVSLLAIVALVGAGCGGYGGDGGSRTPQSGTTTSGGNGY
jgi:hypothetical protein